MEILHLLFIHRQFLHQQTAVRDQACGDNFASIPLV